MNPPGYIDQEFYCWVTHLQTAKDSKQRVSFLTIIGWYSMEAYFSPLAKKTAIRIYTCTCVHIYIYTNIYIYIHMNAIMYIGIYIYALYIIYKSTHIYTKIQCIYICSECS